MGNRAAEEIEKQCVEYDSPYRQFGEYFVVFKHGKASYAQHLVPSIQKEDDVY
ncbi:MAG: hypothetical protein ACOCWH_02985 [Spirochaetota bacterium]